MAQNNVKLLHYKKNYNKMRMKKVILLSDRIK